MWQTCLLDISRLKVTGHLINYFKLKELYILCDVAKAEATVELDRIRILKQIQETVSYEKMNETIKKVLLESARLEAEQCSKSQESNPLKSADSYEKFGLILHFMGRYVEAYSFQERALAFKERQLGSTHVDVARSVHSLAELHYSMGEHKEALLLHRRALNIRENTLGSDHIDTASSLNSLGELLYAMRNYSESYPLYKTALSIR